MAVTPAPMASESSLKRGLMLANDSVKFLAGMGLCSLFIL